MRRWEPRYTEAQMRAAIAPSRSMAEALRRLGLGAAGANFRTLKKLAAYYDISMDHFDPKWSVRLVPKPAPPLQDVLVQNSAYDRGKLKRRLYAEGLKHRRCELCGQDEEWRGRFMSLILDLGFRSS